VARVHHKLDVRPIPERVLYINELNFLETDLYQTNTDCEKAITGEIISKGGILPDDNVRIYIPLDLNSDYIMQQVHILYSILGSPDEENELHFVSGMAKIINQLEVYDQVWVTREVANAVQKEAGGVFHSQKGIDLANKIVAYLEEDEGSAECFPFETIEELKEEFWIE